MDKRGSTGVRVQPIKRTLRQEAQQRGLVHRYTFSGITAYGVDRNDAAAQLMVACYRRAFQLLRREFGSRAHFWPRPKFRVSVDFYWRQANVGVILTGPLYDPYDGRMFGPRARPVRWEDLPGYLDQCAGAARQMKILRIPYYQVWRAPSKAIAAIRIELVASGKYPALASLQKEGEP